MYGITSILGKATEAGIRAQTPDMQPRQRTPEHERAAGGESGVVVAAEAGELAPSRYMMLISRVDRMLARGQVERGVIDQLADYVAERIGGLSPRGRRNLSQLPQLRALGLDDVSALPALARAVFRSDGDVARLMDLLRSQSFAAAMKDETRIATYGPQGLLRAS